MADPLTIATAVSGGLAAAGTLMQGQQAAAAGKAEQQQMDIRAKEELAVAQHQAADDIRQKELAQGALQSRAAASGSGASDKTVMDLYQGIEGVGQQNASTSLAMGQARANSTQYQGALARWRGNTARVNGYFDAAGTLAGTATSAMARRYPTKSSGASGRTGYS